MACLVRRLPVVCAPTAPAAASWAAAPHADTFSTPTVDVQLDMDWGQP